MGPGGKTLTTASGGNFVSVFLIRNKQSPRLGAAPIEDAGIGSEPSADIRIDERDGKEILIYRNTKPNVHGELFGITMTGMDGNTYKISLFTGESEACDADAPVWKIAEIIAETTNYRDFAEWGISTIDAE